MKEIVREEIRKKVETKNEVRRYISSSRQSEREDLSLETKVALELDASYALERLCDNLL